MVEGSTDRALLEGLRRRWCPTAELVPGHFRGSTGQAARREMTKICLELKAKHVDLVIFLRDANKEDWREVQRNDRKRCRPEQEHQTVVGVADRNVECWLCHSAEWLASRCDRPAEDFRAPDPKLAFDAAFGISARDRKEDVIAGLVEEAPLARWLENPSFEDFCQQLWMMSKQRAECRLENLRERRP